HDALPILSLGYFLLPLTMILAGRFLYDERLSRLQQLATLFAVVGVANQLIQVGGLAWETWLVALGYPAYFALRRRLGTYNLGGMLGDMSQEERRVGNASTGENVLYLNNL